MARKTKNNSIQSKNNANKLSDPTNPQQLFLGEYFNIHTFNLHPITKSFAQREAINLKQWSEREESFLIEDFYDLRGYAPEIYYQFVDKFEEFAAAHSYAIRRIGARREMGAALRKLEPSTIHRTLGRYHKVWKEETQLLHEARAALANQDKNSGQTVVVLERFPVIGETPVEIVNSQPRLTPQEVAANIHRNTATQREVRVNTNVGDAIEE